MRDEVCEQESCAPIPRKTSFTMFTSCVGAFTEMRSCYIYYIIILDIILSSFFHKLCMSLVCIGDVLCTLAIVVPLCGLDSSVDYKMEGLSAKPSKKFPNEYRIVPR